MPYPTGTLFPGGSIFPGADIIVNQSFQLFAGGLELTGLDDSGVQWSTHVWDGWNGATASTLQVVPKPRQPGGWGGLAYGSPRHLAASGLIAAPTQDLLVDAMNRLNDAISLAETPYMVVENSSVRGLMGRREGEIVSTYITDRLASWSFQTVCLDPRKLGIPLIGTTLLPMSTGGLTIPFTVPFAINSTVAAGQVTFNNPGNEAGPVILRIDGPCTGPVITHTSSTSTKSMVFSSSLSLGVGEYLMIDMDNRTALANGQTSRSGYITSRQWFSFDPGVNTFSFTASGYNAASQLTVSATPAWK